MTRVPMICWTKPHLELHKLLQVNKRGNRLCVTISRSTKNAITGPLFTTTFISHNINYCETWRPIPSSCPPRSADFPDMVKTLKDLDRSVQCYDLLREQLNSYKEDLINLHNRLSEVDDIARFKNVCYEGSYRFVVSSPLSCEIHFVDFNLYEENFHCNVKPVVHQINNATQSLFGGVPMLELKVPIPCSVARKDPG